MVLLLRRLKKSDTIMTIQKTPTLKIQDLVLVKSYSHKPYLASLPYDLNTNDPDKLKERMYACNEGLKQAQQELKELQKFKENVKKVGQYNNKVKEESKKQLHYINDCWNRVSNLAMEYDDPDELDWYGEMETFIKEMNSNEGFINNEIADKYEAVYGISETDPEHYADQESGYPKWGPLHGFETYLDDRESLEKYVTNYLQNFNIDGNSEYAKEMNSIIEDLPTDWEDKNRTINREIGKAETRVKDYKEHNRKIKEKIERVTDDTWLAELSDGQIVDMNDEIIGREGLTVEDILYDPYDF